MALDILILKEYDWISVVYLANASRSTTDDYGLISPVVLIWLSLPTSFHDGELAQFSEYNQRLIERL